MRKSFKLLGWSIALLLTAINPCLAAAPNDGIPESWRAQYFGANGVDSPQAAATVDPDGDGCINYQEFLAGTNPLDPLSKGRAPRYLSTYSGSIVGGFNGPLNQATYFRPYELNQDPRGRIWVVECATTGFWTSEIGGHRIRMIDTNGIVTTVAGAAEYGYADGPGDQARFQAPSDVVFDSLGNAYVADNQNSRIRKIDTNGIVSTFAGSTAGYQDGTGTNAQFDLPIKLAMDANNNLFVADFGNLRIRKITPAGEVTTFAGTNRGFADGTRLSAQFNSPNGLAFTPDGSLLVSGRMTNFFGLGGEGQRVIARRAGIEPEFPKII